MNEKESAKKIIPPYVPYKTFINFLDNLRQQGVPQKIDRSISPFKSMSGALQGQVRLALEYLNLITDSGETTEGLKKLAKAEDGIEREQALKDVLLPAYSFIFENGIDIESATHRQLEELFTQEGATGDTLRKCTAFFLSAARGAGIKLSPHFKKVRSRRAGSAKPKRQSQAKAPTDKQPAKEPASPPKAAEPTDDSSMKFIIDLMGKFNPEWSKDAQQNWLEAINKLLDRFQKKSGD
ncbi:MAG: hypothetical protein ACLPT6_13710 [Desulfobaccales bacterium]